MGDGGAAPRERRVAVGAMAHTKVDELSSSLLPRSSALQLRNCCATLELGSIWTWAVLGGGIAKARQPNRPMAVTKVAISTKRPL